jgi:hypothetical protein
MSISEKLALGAGETLRMDSTRTKGFVGETDVTCYSVLDASGNIIGTVTHTEHTAVRGFRVTNSATRTDLQGNVVVTANW